MELYNMELLCQNLLPIKPLKPEGFENQFIKNQLYDYLKVYF